jgi:glycosyltransferase involved in cell wall biosynthesis
VARVLLTGWDNLAGTTRDLDLMTQILGQAGHQVDRRGIEPPGLLASLRGRLPRRWDVAIQLERVVPRWMAQARRTVLIPNPEWTDRHTPGLSRVDALWCKSHDAIGLLAPLGRPSRYIGFTTPDLAPDRPLESRHGALHVAGRSRTKGTTAVLDAWRRHPEWPILTIIAWKDRISLPGDPPPNVRIIDDVVSEAALRQLQFGARFHVCPSEAEGYGHTIAEGLSAGAVVISTDAPPMNELVGNDRGILVPATGASPMRMGWRFTVEAGELERTLSLAFARPLEELKILADAGRAWFLANHAAFPARVETAIRDLLEKD